MNLITTSSQLDQLYQNLQHSQVPAIGIDTEFVRKQTYWPILCLVQIYDGQNTYLIDTLSPDLDLLPLKHILMDQSICKVIHAARQDFEIFYHTFQALPQHIFDTQIASLICGFREEIGLAELIHALTGLTLNKGAQYTNWGIRPLKDKQITYAMNDVQHLLTVYGRLSQTITDLGRWSWIHEEQQFLLTPQTYTPDYPHLWQRLSLNGQQNPQMLAILQALCIWRENKAQSLDWNRARVLSDPDLLKLALTFANDEEELEIPSQQYHQELEQCVMEALSKPSTQWPRVKISPRNTTINEPLKAKVLALVTERAQKLDIPPRLLASNSEINKYLLKEISVRFLTGWRYDVIGKEIETLCHP